MASSTKEMSLDHSERYWVCLSALGRFYRSITQRGVSESSVGSCFFLLRKEALARPESTHTSGQLEVKDEKIVTKYISSLRRKGSARTRNYMVHPTALAYLRTRFNYLCTTLVRNDYLSGLSDRFVLCFELFK
ncbi:hypothetical protein BDR03DRAFT_197441 [Suillus americanus]|nr:hypothetical protein BDR03DRAFT_197441 [Suillus americanus]